MSRIGKIHFDLCGGLGNPSHDIRRAVHSEQAVQQWQLRLHPGQGVRALGRGKLGSMPPGLQAVEDLPAELCDVRKGGATVQAVPDDRGADHSKGQAGGEVHVHGM